MTNSVSKLLACTLAITGCKAPSIFGDIPQPVSVEVAFWGSVLEVGSVSRVCAFGMASWGLAVATHRVEAWSLSDPTLAQIEQMPDPADRFACILLRPLHTGRLTVTATMAGVQGSNTVRLIPTVGTIVLTPADFVLRLGDTASVLPIVIAANGDTLRDLPLEWRESDYGVVATVVFYGTGPATRSVVQASAVGENTITAMVVTSRVDSAINVKGHARVTVYPPAAP
jgi:hypothetical protein